MNIKRNGTKEQDEDYVIHSTLNSNDIRVRKRVRLQKKALDAPALVDPPFVPKKLRSALSRRNHQSMVPSSSDSKRNQNKAEEFYKVEERVAEAKEFNKIEKEVAEVLISISNYVTSSNSTKSNEEVMKLEKKSETKASSSSPPLEVPEEHTMSLFPCSNSILEKNTSDYITQENTKPELLMKSNESRTNLSNQIGGTHQYIPPLNGMSQPTQLDSHSVQKQEFQLGIGPAPVEHKLQTPQHKNGSLLRTINGKAPSLQFELPSRSHEQMSMPSLSNSMNYPDAVLGKPVIGSTNLNTLPEKLSLSSTDMKRPWSKCMTHVYISHLIKNNKRKEMKLPMLHGNQLKPKNEIFSFTSNAINGSKSDMIHPPSKSLLDLNNSETARNHIHSYDPQKQESETMPKLLLPFPPNQAVMPFNFSPMPYTSQYQDQLANASNQQAQLQHLPHLISNSQLHQHQQQHQLFWQSQMAQYRPNRMHHGSSSSSSSTLPSNLQQPSIFSFIPNFNQQIQQQFVPLPPPSISSRLSNAESYR